MACPVCPTAGWFGSLIGGYIGINPPKHFGARLFSAVSTAAMVTISVVALKQIFDIVLCDGKGNFSFMNIAQVTAISLVMGIVYSIAMNYLINNYLFQEPAHKPCCGRV